MAAPAIDGLWKELPYTCPINPVHGALLSTSKVLFVAGSGNNTKNVNTPNGSAVFDYEKGTFERPITPVDENGKPFDLFCGGHSFLSDGTLLFAGGTLQYTPFKGLPVAVVFSPKNNQWKTVQPMQYGRWYPTLVTLSDGRVLAVSGRNENGPICKLPEIYDPVENTWTTFKETSKLPMYAHLFLLSTGQIFYSGIRFSTYQGLAPRLLTLPTNLTQPIAEKTVPGIQNSRFR